MEQEPTVCGVEILSELVEFFQLTAMLTGVVLQSETILNFTPVTVPVNASGPVPATVSGHGRLLNTGTAHSGLEPLTVAPVIEAPAPPLFTVPVKIMLQVTGIFRDAGDRTLMEPAVVKDAPAGAMVAALAIETAPKHRAKEVAQTRVLKLFIIFPHMLRRVHFARGNGHEREVTVKQAELPFPAKSQFNYRNNY